MRKLIIIVDNLECIDVDANLIESGGAIMNRLVVNALPILAFCHVGQALAVKQRIVFLISLSQRHIFGRILGIHVVTINFNFTPSNIDLVFAIVARPLVVLDAFA